MPSPRLRRGDCARGRGQRLAPNICFAQPSAERRLGRGRSWTDRGRPNRRRRRPGTAPSRGGRPAGVVPKPRGFARGLPAEAHWPREGGAVVFPAGARELRPGRRRGRALALRPGAEGARCLCGRYRPAHQHPPDGHGIRPWPRQPPPGGGARSSPGWAGRAELAQPVGARGRAGLAPGQPSLRVQRVQTGGGRTEVGRERGVDQERARGVPVRG